MSKSTTAVCAAEKAKRKARDEVRVKIAAAAYEIEEALHNLIESKATELGATVWNGLVHIKSKEWADKKADYQGSAFIGYIVERIHKDNLYDIDNMSQEEKDSYLKAARQSRAAKLNAGTAKTSTDQLVQGSVKTEASAMMQRLDYLHLNTAIEFILFVVKGRPQDGLVGMYHTSPKARTFMESHLSLPIGHFVELMQGSVLGGAAGLLGSHQNPTQMAKTELRQTFLKSLREAAVSVGKDGSAPMISDPLEISMVEYKNYVNIIRQYKVEMVGWPIDSNGSLVDPGTMGLAKLRTFTKLINDPNSDYGFRRISNADWEARCRKYDEGIATGSIKVSTRKVRSDSGKKRKGTEVIDAIELAQSMANQKKKHDEKTKKSNKAKYRSKKGLKKSQDNPDIPIAEPPNGDIVEG
ncbi:hypothetical protein BN14_10716 [Rhizoctonia solani AG-1 IB]|uniref:Uncharacterized protein n=1 Tax=Thanatephorus cucumeris (strain AG1-IB / isolate 7/3/14) TaxID=1108050 RepID=M5CAX9_THACB|nr:hypothetical protein BN14_10716 [Rhizoctonia solani AG-1 IB]